MWREATFEEVLAEWRKCGYLHSAITSLPGASAIAFIKAILGHDLEHPLPDEARLAAYEAARAEVRRGRALHPQAAEDIELALFLELFPGLPAQDAIRAVNAIVRNPRPLRWAGLRRRIDEEPPVREAYNAAISDVEATVIDATMRLAADPSMVLRAASAGVGIADSLKRGLPRSPSGGLLEQLS